MSDSDDFTQLDDPAFLTERRRMRDELEHAPEHAVSPEMTARYQAMNEEFLRRARLAWTQDT
jgi:hypothetical protein